VEKTDLVHQALESIQSDYLNLLLLLKNQLSEKTHAAILDNINIFWCKHKRFIDSTLRKLYKPFSAYIFTGAVSLDIAGNEHFPFVLLGDYHIFDDPVCSYIQTPESCNPIFDKRMKKVLQKAIENNLKILTECSERILILPMRFLIESNIEDLTKIGEDLFWALFQEPEFVKKEWSSIKTLEEIDKLLAPGAMRQILLSDEDDIRLNLSERLRLFINGQNLPFPPDVSDMYIFKPVVMSMIMQAVCIISTCVSFNMVPYIRYKPVFINVLYLENIFARDMGTRDLFLKMTIGHILHYRVDREECSSITYDTFYEFAVSYNLQEKIITELFEGEITLDNWSMDKALSVIDRNLDTFYKALSSRGLSVGCT